MSTWSRHNPGQTPPPSIDDIKTPEATPIIPVHPNINEDHIEMELDIDQDSPHTDTDGGDHDSSTDLESHIPPPVHAVEDPHDPRPLLVSSSSDDSDPRSLSDSTSSSDSLSSDDDIPISQVDRDIQDLIQQVLKPLYPGSSIRTLAVMTTLFRKHSQMSGQIVQLASTFDILHWTLPSGHNLPSLTDSQRVMNHLGNLHISIWESNSIIIILYTPLAIYRWQQYSTYPSMFHNGA